MTAQPSPDLPDSLQRQTKPAGEDVYQAAAGAFVGASPWNASAPDVQLAAIDEWSTSRSFRAAVDEAVRLTEQRVRAEMGADPETCPVDHRCDEDGPCGCWCEVHDCPIAECPTFQMVDATLSQLTADLAAMTARAESAAHLIEQLKAGRQTWKDKAEQFAALYHEVEARARIVDITQLGDAGTRTLCGVCGREQFTPMAPETAPASTLRPEPATVEGADAGGSDGLSEGVRRLIEMGGDTHTCAAPDLVDITTPRDLSHCLQCRTCGCQIVFARTGGAG